MLTEDAYFLPATLPDLTIDTRNMLLIGNHDGEWCYLPVTFPEAREGSVQCDWRCGGRRR